TGDIGIDSTTRVAELPESTPRVEPGVESNVAVGPLLPRGESLPPLVELPDVVEAPGVVEPELEAEPADSPDVDVTAFGALAVEGGGLTRASASSSSPAL